MESKFRPGRINLVFFLSFFFLVALNFSSYYELRELDMFLPNLQLENPNLATLESSEKVKSNLSLSYSTSYFDYPFSAVGFQEQKVSFLVPTVPDKPNNSLLLC
jgi:hypothetical protein